MIEIGYLVCFIALGLVAVLFFGKVFAIVACAYDMQMYEGSYRSSLVSSKKLQHGSILERYIVQYVNIHKKNGNERIVHEFYVENTYPTSTEEVPSRFASAKVVSKTNGKTMDAAFSSTRDEVIGHLNKKYIEEVFEHSNK